jgi:hypothetical protein
MQISRHTKEQWIQFVALAQSASGLTLGDLEQWEQFVSLGRSKCTSFLASLTNVASKNRDFLF